MDAELQRTAQQLEQASLPEAVFGEIGSSAAEQPVNLKKAYHRLAKITHPDAYTSRDDQLLAQAAFNRLSEWYERAQTKLAAGIYGRGGPSNDWRLVLETKRGQYVLENRPVEGPVYASYPADCIRDGRRQAVTLKITRAAHDNDLAANEASTLQALVNGKAAKKFKAYLPRLLDSFLYREDGEARQVNVFERAGGWVSLEQVRQAYPGGIDPRDMAWMWRRLLVALGFAHLNGIIHGAVLPANVLIQPEQHGLVLAEWSFALSYPQASGAYVPVLDPAYLGWYPCEVLQRESPLASTDIDMTARCMIYVLGGDPAADARQPARTLPGGLSQPLHLFFKGCTLAGKHARPQDAWALKEEFDALLQRLWGERKFHPFVMTSGG
jgi:serine/threonine protein kinase